MRFTEMRLHVSGRAFVALAIVALLVSTARLRAQQSEFPSMQTAGWTFTPGVVASLVHDDNVGLVSSVPTRPAQGDQIFQLAPYGQLTYHGPRATFESSYRGSMRRYFDLDQLNGYDQRASAGFRFRATRRVTYFMQESFMKVPTTDELELNGITFLRTGSRTNSLVGGVSSRLSRYTDLNVRYEFTWVDFDDAAVQLNSGLMHAVRTELSRRLTDRSAVGAEYGVRAADVNEGARTLLFQEVGGTYHYTAGPRTSLDAGAGVSHMLDRTLNETRTGPYVRAGVAHSMQRATLGASYAREFLPTFGFGGSSRSESARAFVTMPFDRNRFYVQQSVAWRRTDPLVQTTQRLNSMWLNSTLGYAMTRAVRVEGFYSFSRQDANVPGGLITRQRLGAQVAFAQPVRIR